MYNTIKLDKGLYNLSGKTFTEALCEMDPDTNYSDTELAGLDAYERQLKRFDIKVSGEGSDTIEKFFLSTESAILFPEFVKRAIKAGMNSSALSEIVAAKTKTNSADCRGISIVAEENKPYSTVTAEGNALPETAIKLSSSLVTMSKFGRSISTTYETIRNQRLDVLAVSLMSIGAQIADAVFAQAVGVLKNGITPDSMAGGEFNYAELAKFWGKFGSYDMTTIIAKPETMAKILSFEQMKYADGNFMATGAVKTPFGATLIKSGAVDDGTIIGLDKSCALEMINGSDIVLETDKLISRQVETIAVSVTTGFAKIIPEAVRVLDIA